MQRKDASAMARLQAQCRVDRRAAESLRGRPNTRSRRRQVGLAVSAALVAAVAAANPAQAAIEIDHGIEFVNVTDVPENTPLLLTVTAPNGATIGSKAFTTATGAYEVNHTGAADGDCWDGATSPDVRPGDTLAVSDNTGTTLQSYQVADVNYVARFDAAVPADPVAGTPALPATMVVSGWARSFGTTTPIAAPELRVQRGPFDAGADVTGGNLDQNRVNRLLIGPDQDATGAFTTAIFPVTASQVSEAILEVIEGANATSTSGDAGFALPGCPALDTTRGPVTVPTLPPPPAPVGDSDGDSVKNDVDMCPDVAGPVNNDGCPVPVIERLITSTVINTIPAGAAVAGVNATSVAPARLSLSGLSMSRTVTRSVARANGLTAAMRLKPDTKVLRIRIYRKNAGGSRSLVAERVQSPAAAGQYRARLKDRKLRQALKPGSYEVQVTPGRNRSALGTTAKFAFRVTP